MTERWWESAVVYHAYPRSFATADPAGESRKERFAAMPDRAAPDRFDGVGDLDGIRRRLDHLVRLGVDALWLSPIHVSPMADFGYDVADYCAVDPLFGTLDDLDAMVAEAHERGIRVILDWVPNHTSDRHPWFVEARSSRDSPRRDWYIWRDGSPDHPPNNWVAAFTRGPAWTWDDATGQWYLHMFLPQQPDLNWANPRVVEAMHGTLRFWLDRGVDGFRIDVVHGLGKDPDLPDDPPETAGTPHSSLNDHESTHAIIRGLRGVLAEYPGDRLLVGEVYLLSTEQIARYYGRGDELHLAFNFPPMFAPWSAKGWRGFLEEAEELLRPRGAWPTWVLSNHDNPRHRTRYGTEARARAAAVLLLTLRGTPFVYAGEELGLEDAVVPPERVVDPGGRDGCRAPIPWDASPEHGWGTADPWLPWPPEPDRRNVESLLADPASILHLYRRLLEARRASDALSGGDFRLVDTPAGVVGWVREAGDDHRLVLVNFTDGPVEVAVEGTWTVEVASDGAGEGDRYPGRLGADQAVLLA